MNFIKYIKEKKINKKITKYFFMFFLVFLFSFDSTFAADFNEIKQTISLVAEFLLKWISLLLALMTYLSAIFLSPEWINGSLFWLNTYFDKIWILISNIVYTVFAFILIWIAFMNIIWKNSDQYQLKQALPKFIVWILIVPFSKFLVQFILSLSAILTVSALSLPFETFDLFESKLSDVQVPTDCTLDLSSFLWEDEWGTSSWNENDWFIKCDHENTKSLTEITWKWDAINSIFWIVSMYTYGILSLDTIDDVTALNLQQLKTMWDLVVKIVFDLIFVIVYSVLIITLWFVLMIRWIYIWLYIMFSPVFWLMYFFGKKDWGGEWLFAKFSFKEFIALAMVPVYTMLALSFWLLFLFVVWAWVTAPSNTSSDIVVDQSKIKIGEFTLNIKWQVSEVENVTKFWKEIWWGALWIVWSLIIKVFGIVLLRWTMMAAMRKSEITKQITETVYKFGSQVWGMVSAIPWNIPIFGWQSANSLGVIWQKAQWYFQNKEALRANEFMEKHNLFWSDPFTWKMSINNNNANSVSSWEQTKNLLEKVFKDMWWKEEKLNTKEFKELLNNIALNTRSGASEEFKNYMDSKKWQATLNNNEVTEALNKLETPIINLDYNWDPTTGWNYSQLRNHIRNNWNNTWNNTWNNNNWNNNNWNNTWNNTNITPPSDLVNLKTRMNDVTTKDQAITDLATAIKDQIKGLSLTEVQALDKIKTDLDIDNVAIVWEIVDKLKWIDPVIFNSPTP